jgi:hypothetical protein
MNKTFELWEKIFLAKKFDLTKDLHFVSADEIKMITGAEPRIMAKVDASRDLPDVFARNGYFLLPVKNGEYAIVRGNGFHKLEEAVDPKNHISRIKFHLTTAGRSKSEMQYLDYSFNSGALESILGVSPLYQSIRGREYSKQFKFIVNKTSLDISSVQLEVDSGLEGEDSIVLIEAKINNPEDFMIRQLFYPYNHFKIVSPNKKIIPVFFTYELSTKIYNFWIYEFTDQGNYNSIRLKESRSVKIVTKHEVELAEIKPKGVVGYKDLIPQANDLNKVIELAFKVNEGINNYQGIAQYFEFNERQSSYYREAAEALGLVISEKGQYRLTEIGRQLVSLPAEKRNLFMVELISDFSLIKNCIDIIGTKGKLSRIDIEKQIAKQSNLSASTVTRRAHSLFSWFGWIAEVTGSLVLKEGVVWLKE